MTNDLKVFGIWAKIESVDFSQVMGSIQEKHRFDLQKTHACIDMYKNLLKIAFLFPGKMVVPPWCVDVVCHLHFESMKACSRQRMYMLGRYVYHDATIFNTEPFWYAWRFTKEKMHELFDEDLDLTKKLAAKPYEFDAAVCAITVV